MWRRAIRITSASCARRRSRHEESVDAEEQCADFDRAVARPCVLGRTNQTACACPDAAAKRAARAGVFPSEYSPWPARPSRKSYTKSWFEMAQSAGSGRGSDQKNECARATKSDAPVTQRRASSFVSPRSARILTRALWRLGSNRYVCEGLCVEGALLR